MHHVQLNDQLYEQAKRRASEGGFKSVDDYVADVVSLDIEDPEENFDHIFTPEVLAELDAASAQAKAGHTFNVKEARAELARRRAEWLEKNQS